MRKLSLLKTIQNTAISLLMISALIYFTTSVYSRYRQFDDEIKNERDREINDIKTMLKGEVDHVIDHTKFLRSEIRKRAEKNAKTRVYEAHGIANHIYSIYKNKKNSKEIKEIIREALRSIRFDNGNGYFFITDFNGYEILFADRPQLEGQNISHMKDTEGKYVIRDMIKIVKTKGEGFYNYTWTKPDKEDRGYAKVGFVKKFAPYNWFIGTGVYIDDIDQLTKQDALDIIRQERFGQSKREYIFAGKYDGVSLSGPATGQNMISVTDENGVEIVKELIRKAQSGGGFVEYVMPKINGYKPEPKISYSKGIDEWGWYVGAGVYIDEIEDRIVLLKEKRRNEFIIDVFLILAITFLIIVFILLIMNYLGKHVVEDINLFNTFFKNLAEKNEKIHRDSIRFKEFDFMAEYANRMLIEKISTERSLQKSEDQFKMLFSKAPIGIVLEDKDLNVIISNEAFQKMLDYSKDELKQMNSRDFSVESDMEEDLRQYNDLLLGKKEFYRLEKRYYKKNKDIVWGYITRTVIFSDEKEPLWSIVMIENLTERRKLQDQIRQAEKMETIGQLAGGIAHDFNNQLAGIMGFAELLHDMTNDNEEIQKYTEFILNSVKNSAELTSQLLAFARKGKVQSIGIDIHEIINEVNSILQHSLPKNITIVQKLDAETCKIKGDPTQIQNAVLNLAINARDAMAEGGHITFETAVKELTEEECQKRPYKMEVGRYLQISVSDSGIGMSEEVMKKIFEPFFTTKELGKGTGMGLAAVYGTVKSHKGAIAVKSTIGKGTVFEILLPLLTDKKNISNEIVDNSAVMGEGLILLVDDEEMLRSMGSKLLENLGYSVVVCANGQEAVDYYEKNWSKVSLVILDMVMPVLGGKDTFLIMKEINPSVKVILASGYSIEGEAQALLKNGVRGFLQKPFRKTEFSKIVSKAINS